MISQNFPLYVTWWTEAQTTREHWVRNTGGDMSPRVAGARIAGEIRYNQTGLVVGWWAVPGHVSTVLVPIVAGVDERPTAPVVDECPHFFYSETMEGRPSVHEALEAFLTASAEVSTDRGIRDAVLSVATD